MDSPRYVVLGLAALWGLTLGTTGAARADLTWEHSGQVRLTKARQPVMKFKVFTNMTPSRLRTMLKYDLNPAALGTVMSGPQGTALGGPQPIPGMQTLNAPLLAPILALAQLGDTAPGASPPAASPPGASPDMSDAMPNPFQGNVALVQRFDDAQFLAYASMPKQYIHEPIQDVLTKYRFDPWKKLAPKLSQNEPPSLTYEQRARLGAEVRAVLAPYIGRVCKTYFRELSEKRTFNGIEGRGYRLTMMFNTDNPFAGAGRWVNVAWEWWIAGELPGDENVAQLREAALKTVGRDYKNSTSMWFNESPKVMWEMMPEEIHRAAYTLVPRPDAASDSPEFKRANMPLAMYMTVTLPPAWREKTGDIRAEMLLVRRSTDALPAHVFEAPSGYKRVPLADIVKQAEQAAQSAKPPMPGM